MSLEERIESLNNTNARQKMTYSVKELTEILCVTRQTVYKLIEKKCFKAVKADGAYRISKVSFDNWLDNE